MKTRLQNSLLILALAAGAVLFPPAAQAAPAANSGDAAKGQAVYEGTCIFCHGKKGRGEIPGTPDFTKAGGPLAQDDAILIEHITDGFESPSVDMPMPAKGGNPELSDKDIQNALTYLRKAFGKAQK